MSRPSESGIALLAVMLGLIVISVLAIGLILTTRAGMREAKSTLISSEAQAFADAVILQTSVLLLDTSAPTRPRIDGVPQTIFVLGQPVSIAITSEFGKVDLNGSDAATLTKLLIAAGLGPAIATDEASRIIAWRSDGTGTTDSTPFRTTAELTEVPGITSALYATLAPAITVFDGRGRIDPATAPLLALQATGMDAATAQATIHDRETNQDSGSYGEIAHGQIQPGITITNWPFTIQASFTISGRIEYLTATIIMTGESTRPFLTLARQQIPE